MNINDASACIGRDMSSNGKPMAAKPTKVIFDPFNSSATGHQRAENRLSGSTSWRESRNLKLNQQYTSGRGGGKRQSDIVGAGSENFGLDGRLENGGWEKGAQGLRTNGQQSIWESMKVSRPVDRPVKDVDTIQDSILKPTTVVNPWTPFRKGDGSVRETSWTSHEVRQEHQIMPTSLPSGESTVNDDDAPELDEGSIDDAQTNGIATPRQIFAGLTIYINGSTAPLISDHKLKHLLSAHGARTSIALSRRTVTHIIVGRPNNHGGAGGGLAGSKLHREITRHGGKNVKFVTAEWVVESIKANRRLAEATFSSLNLHANGVGNVANMFSSAMGSTKKYQSIGKG